MSLKLFINSTLPKKAVVSIIDNKNKILAQQEAEEPLIAIDKLLKRTKMKLNDLETIESHPGPGSFTSLRIGATLASALNLALGRVVKPTKIRYENPNQIIKNKPRRIR